MIELHNINERIAYVVQTSGLTKSAFAQRLNVSQPFISEICSGKKTPSDRTIADICREFCINEVWLRTGDGEMTREVSEQDELAAYVGALLAGQRSKAEEVLISTLARLNEDDLALLDRMLSNISAEWAKKEKHEE